MAEAGTVKLPSQIYGEVCDSSDLLGQWLRQPDVKKAVILDEPADMAAIQHVVALGYAPDLTDVETIKFGRDPFLVAACLGRSDRIVVTREVSRPSLQRANRKVPDVCKSLGVVAITDFELWRVLAFSIK